MLRSSRNGPANETGRQRGSHETQRQPEVKQLSNRANEQNDRNDIGTPDHDRDGLARDGPETVGRRLAFHGSRTLTRHACTTWIPKFELRVRYTEKPAGNA